MANLSSSEQLDNYTNISDLPTRRFTYGTEFLLHCLKFDNEPHSDRTGGGICLIYLESFEMKRLPTKTYKSINMLFQV